MAGRSRVFNSKQAGIWKDQGTWRSQADHWRGNSQEQEDGETFWRMPTYFQLTTDQCTHIRKPPRAENIATKGGTLNTLSFPSSPSRVDPFAVHRAHRHVCISLHLRVWQISLQQNAAVAAWQTLKSRTERTKLFPSSRAASLHRQL